MYSDFKKKLVYFLHEDIINILIITKAGQIFKKKLNIK